MFRISLSLALVFALPAAHAGNYEDGVRLLEAKAFVKAAAAFRLSAAEGNAAAERQLGFMYYRGEGVKQSDAEAVAWFERSASHGDLQSQVNLGQMYENGLSVAQSDARSAQWYRMAAEQGDRRSQLRFGQICYLGAGVPRDRAEAVKWWHLATRKEDEVAARMRSMIQSAVDKISPEERGEGRKRAEEWLAVKSKRND